MGLSSELTRELPLLFSAGTDLGKYVPVAVPTTSRSALLLASTTAKRNNPRLDIHQPFIGLELGERHWKSPERVVTLASTRSRISRRHFLLTHRSLRVRSLSRWLLVVPLCFHHVSPRCREDTSAPGIGAG